MDPLLLLQVGNISCVTGNSVAMTEQQLFSPGTPVLLQDGRTGVLLAHSTEDSMYKIRFGGARGALSETLSLPRGKIVRSVRGAEGFAVRTSLGRGVVRKIDVAKDSDDIEDFFIVELGWKLSTGDAAVGYFDGASVECVGAAVLPVVERLSNQANLFLAWSATHMNRIVDNFSGVDNDHADPNQLSFLDKIQDGLAGSGEVLLSKLSKRGGDHGEIIEGEENIVSEGETAIREHLQGTRTAAKQILAEFEDAERTESRVRSLLDEARKRIKELATTQPIMELQRNATAALDGALAESLSGAGGIGVEDLTAGLDKASKLTTNKDALARLVQEGQERCRVIGEESGAFDQLSSALSKSGAAKDIEAAKATIAEVLSPTIKATADIVAGPVDNSHDGEGENAAVSSKNVDSIGASDINEVSDATKRASDAAMLKLSAAQREVECQLQASKEQIDVKMKELSTEVTSAVSSLFNIAKEDDKLADILKQLEGQSRTIESLQSKFAASKAAREAQMGKEMVLGRMEKLLQAKEVNMVKSTGMRIAARVMDDDSVARKKSDQLLRSVTSRIQSRLLGVTSPNGATVEGTDHDRVSSLYDLLNVDALLGTVEKDLVRFLMVQHQHLTDKSENSVVSQLEGVLDDDSWDPRVQFMVSFIKDCTKVSIKDQLSQGLEGIRERMRDPASLKVPIEAVIRLENALLDLLDLGSGGLVELYDLATFWEFIERGDSLTAASQRVLAFLPELEKSAEVFVEEIDSNVLGVKTEFNRSKEGNDSKQPSAPAQRRQRLRSGLTGAVAKLGGDIPAPVRELLAAQGGLKGITSGVTASAGGIPLTMDGAINKGVGLLNSESVVHQVQNLVTGAGGALSSIEALQSDARVQAALATLASPEMEAKFMSGIENVNVDALVDDAELALTDRAARQRLVDGMKDACLEFLLQYLPSMPIPPIDGEEDGLEYSISNLDLSRFRLRKEDVSVILGDLSDLNLHVMKDREAAAASSATSTNVDNLLHRNEKSMPTMPPPPPHAKNERKIDSTLITIKAKNISAEFVQLHWSYKQKFFPYLEGGGYCDAVVQDASIALSFDIRKDFRRKRDSTKAATAPTSGEKVAGSNARDNMATGTEGSGTIAALLEVAGASESVVAAANAITPGNKQSQPQTSLIWEPVLILGNCDIQISDLELRMAATGSMAWVYNLLAGLFRDQIREYIIGSLGDTIAENAESLLGAINGFVRTSWPVIAAATKANLDTIPILERDVAVGQSNELRRRTAGGRQIRIKLNEAGPLGLHLDINTKRGIIRFSAPVPDGQAEAQVRAVEAVIPDGRTLKGAYLTAIDGRSVSGLSISETLVLLKQENRPKVLGFVLPAPRQVTNNIRTNPHHKDTRRVNVAANTSKLREVKVEFTEPSLGMKIKPSPTLPQLIAVTGFAPGGPNGPLPAEASGKIEIGMLLAEVNEVALWGLSFQEVAQSLKAAAAEVTQNRPNRKLILTFVESPDIRVNFKAPPNDLILARMQSDSPNDSGRDEYYVVVTGFEGQPGPLQVLPGRPGGFFVGVGDTLLSANGRLFPGPPGSSYREDVLSLRNASYPLTLEFIGDRYPNTVKVPSGQPEEGVGGASERVRFTVTIDTNPGKKLGVVFGCGQDDGRPIVKRFDSVPGVALRSGVVCPGMVLLAIGDRAVDSCLVTNSSLAAAATTVPNDGGVSPSMASSSVVGKASTLTLDECTSLLKNSSYPETPVIFRDMEKFIELQRRYGKRHQTAGAP